MASEMRADAVVIGSGPGGYVCGIRLGQLGVKAVVVERASPGGVCLNVGCIPSKALIHAAKTYEKLGQSSSIGINVSSAPTVDMAKMQTWKGGIVKKLTQGVKHLLKANGTELIRGDARIESAGPDGYRVVVEGGDAAQAVITKNIVVATGSRPIEIPGFETDGKRVIDSTGALALAKVPKSMVVVGGGYIGLELGTVYAKLGTKVTVVEALDSVLAGMDKECVAVVARKLRKKGIEVMLNAKAKSWQERDDRATMVVDTGSGEATIDTDVILVSVGRRPNSETLGLDKLGVRLDRGFVAVDSQLRTNVSRHIRDR